MSDVYVLGLAMASASLRRDDVRLEELVYDTSARALEAARVSRRQLDHITLGASDELDGRPISSMLMAAPAGGYATDEIRVTDSGLMALCLGYARMLTGEFRLGLVASWCKSSKSDIEAVLAMRCDPFFTRPVGVGGLVSDALFAQAVAAEMDISEAEVAERVVRAHARAARNPRGLRPEVPVAESVRGSPYEATPLRSAHRATPTDGAISMVIASNAFLAANRDCRALARIAGAGWASDSYGLGRDRLRAMRSARTAWQAALRQAGLTRAADLDVIELEAQTAWHEAAYVRAFGIADESALSPSGGAFAQNPVFCTGLINAAEAVLQVSGGAGPVQRPRARRAVAHGHHGFAQQGNVVVVLEAAGGAG